MHCIFIPRHIALRTAISAVALCAGCLGGTGRSPEVRDAGAEVPALSADCPVIPATGVASADDRETLFRFLTASDWGNSTEDLQLQRDGRYRRQQNGSDFLVAPLAGEWTLVAYDARTGAVFLDDQTLAPVERRDDGRLGFGFELFQAQGARAPGAGEAGRTAADLKPPRLPRQLTPLLDVCWRKANALELQREPEWIALGLDGRFRSAFRSSSCLQDGTFLFSADQAHPRLWLLGQPSCALDDASPGWKTEPALVGNLLVLAGIADQLPAEHQARAFRAVGAPGPSTFVEPGFELTLVGSYDEAPIAGRPWLLRLSFESLLTRAHLGDLTIESQAVDGSGGPFVAVGSPAVLVEKSLDVLLERGQKHDEAVELRFPASGPRMQLRIRLDARDAMSGGPLLDSTDYAFVTAVAADAGP